METLALNWKCIFLIFFCIVNQNPIANLLTQKRDVAIRLYLLDFYGETKTLFALKDFFHDIHLTISSSRTIGHAFFGKTFDTTANNTNNTNNIALKVIGEAASSVNNLVNRAFSSFWISCWGLVISCCVFWP